MRKFIALFSISLLFCFLPGQAPSCAPDADNDSISDPQDNCPEKYNPFQTDEDSDGLGDACDILSSCKAIQELTQDVIPKPDSGTYTIDPDGDAGAIESFETYCDMVTAGGGWSLIFNLNTSDANTRHFKDTKFWVEKDSAGAMDAPFVEDCKSDAFSTLLLGSEIMVWVHNQGNTNFGRAIYNVLDDFQENTFHELFAQNNLVISSPRATKEAGDPHKVSAKDPFLDETHAIKLNALRSMPGHSGKDMRDHTRFATAVPYGNGGHEVSGLGGDHGISCTCCGGYGWLYEAQMHQSYCSVWRIGTNQANNGYPCNGYSSCNSSKTDVDYAVFVR